MPIYTSELKKTGDAVIHNSGTGSTINAAFVIDGTHHNGVQARSNIAFALGTTGENVPTGTSAYAISLTNGALKINGGNAISSGKSITIEFWLIAPGVTKDAGNGFTAIFEDVPEQNDNDDIIIQSAASSDSSFSSPSTVEVYWQKSATNLDPDSFSSLSTLGRIKPDEMPKYSGGNAGLAANAGLVLHAYKVNFKLDAAKFIRLKKDGVHGTGDHVFLYDVKVIIEDHDDEDISKIASRESLTFQIDKDSSNIGGVERFSFRAGDSATELAHLQESGKLRMGPPLSNPPNEVTVTEITGDRVKTKEVTHLEEGNTTKVNLDNKATAGWWLKIAESVMSSSFNINSRETGVGVFLLSISGREDSDTYDIEHTMIVTVSYCPSASGSYHYADGTHIQCESINSEKLVGWDPNTDIALRIVQSTNHAAYLYIYMRRALKDVFITPLLNTDRIGFDGAGSQEHSNYGFKAVPRYRGNAITNNFINNNLPTSELDSEGNSTNNITTVYGKWADKHVGKLKISDKASPQITIERYGPETTQNTILFSKLRGTKASPAPLDDGDPIGSLIFSGYDTAAGSHLHSDASAQIQVVADGEHGTSSDATDQPGRIHFKTTPNGSSTLETRMTIKSDGKVGINEDTPSEMLEVDGNIKSTGTVTAANIFAPQYFHKAINGETNAVSANGTMNPFGSANGASYHGTFYGGGPVPVSGDSGRVEGFTANAVYRITFCYKFGDSGVGTGFGKTTLRINRHTGSSALQLREVEVYPYGVDGSGQQNIHDGGTIEAFFTASGASGEYVECILAETSVGAADRPTLATGTSLTIVRIA